MIKAILIGIATAIYAAQMIAGAAAKTPPPAQPATEAEQPIDGTEVSLRDLWEMSYE